MYVSTEYIMALYGNILCFHKRVAGTVKKKKKMIPRWILNDTDILLKVAVFEKYFSRRWHINTNYLLGAPRNRQKNVHWSKMSASVYTRRYIVLSDKKITMRALPSTFDQCRRHPAVISSLHAAAVQRKAFMCKIMFSNLIVPATYWLILPA